MSQPPESAASHATSSPVSPQPQAVPRAGLWRACETAPRLLAARCSACGLLAFPAADGCIACGAPSPAIVELSPRGRVETCTRIGERVVCEVRLDEGPLVLGWLDSPVAVASGTVVRFSPLPAQLRFVVDG